MNRLLIYFLTFFLVTSFASHTGAQISSDDSYKIGINDVLSIDVLENPDLKTLATVSSDGTIAFPYIGAVNVKGMSLAEIDEIITKRLSDGYIKYPVVTVSLVKSMSRKIYAYGEFIRRGEVTFEDGMTVMKVMSIVGGASVDGLFGKLIVRRKQGDSNKYYDLIEADINNGFLYDRKTEDTLLEPDDILMIERNKTFLIQGDVTHRGRMVLEKDMTVLRALLQAGGVTEDGLFGKLRIRRKEAGTSGKYKDLAESEINDGVIEHSEVEEMILEPDDILIVERNKTFLIEGQVVKRGRMVHEKGMTVLRALLQAGGVTDNGLYGTVKIRRMHGGKGEDYKDIAEAQLNNGVIKDSEVEDILLDPDDILLVEMSKTILMQGEVVKRGRMVKETGMTVLRALLQAGGVTDNGLYGAIKVRRKLPGEGAEYKDFVEAKLNNGIIMNSEVENTLLEPDDILVVDRNKTYYIYGEVNKVGEFVLKDDITVFQALTIAGGFTKWGSSSRVKVLRMKEGSSELETIKINIDKVIDGDAHADIILKPEDMVIVSTGIL